MKYSSTRNGGYEEMPYYILDISDDKEYPGSKPGKNLRKQIDPENRLNFEILEGKRPSGNPGVVVRLLECTDKDSANKSAAYGAWFSCNEISWLICRFAALKDEDHLGQLCYTEPVPILPVPEGDSPSFSNYFKPDIDSFYLRNNRLNSSKILQDCETKHTGCFPAPKPFDIPKVWLDPANPIPNDTQRQLECETHSLFADISRSNKKGVVFNRAIGLLSITKTEVLKDYLGKSTCPEKLIVQQAEMLDLKQLRIDLPHTDLVKVGLHQKKPGKLELLLARRRRMQHDKGILTQLKRILP